MNFHLERNSDQTYDMVVILNTTIFSEEFSKEFLDACKDAKNKKLRFIKFVIAGALVLTIPFSQAIAKGPRYAMSYIYFGSHSQQLEYISLAQDTLAVVSPSYFDIGTDGILSINYISKSYIDSVHEKGIRVVPFLSNHWDREGGIKALDNLDALSSQLAAAVEQYNLDGINVDIENVTHNERDKYSEFVRQLRHKIPEHKEVSVAVAANPNGWTQGWHGSYDYRALGEAADHLFIMSYDEHYQGGEPGPVASIQFVEQSIQYALKHTKPEKIVLGIPFFGRIWAQDGSTKGLGIPINRAEQVIKDYRASLGYDTDRRSPYAEFTVSSNDNLVINGKTLSPGKHTIWYENSNSIKDKLALVDKYNLKGAGNWSSGQETRDVWDYYDLWLNGKYFEDIFSHFAKDEIIKTVKKGYMVGTSNTMFSPEHGLKRGEAAAIAARYMGLGTDNTVQTFPDTAGHWAQAHIAAAVQAGILKGYPDGSFRPEQEVTREEMAAMLTRMIQLDYSGKNAPFTDVDSERWSYDEIRALAGAGILKGYEDGSFRPERILTRGEMAALLERADSKGQ